MLESHEQYRMDADELARIRATQRIEIENSTMKRLQNYVSINLSTKKFATRHANFTG